MKVPNVWRWRWWHIVSLFLLAVLPLLGWLLMRLDDALVAYDQSHTPGLTVRQFNFYSTMIGWGFAVALLLPAVWITVVAPWFDSGDCHFGDRYPPRVRRRILRMMAWVPCAFTAGVLAIFALDAGLEWQESGVWDPVAIDSYVIWVVLASSTVWGAIYGWVLQRRLQTIAARVHLCNHCAYSLAEIPNCTRCPECGTAVESSVDSTPPGDAAVSTARD